MNKTNSTHEKEMLIKEILNMLKESEDIELIHLIYTLLYKSNKD